MYVCIRPMGFANPCFLFQVKTFEALSIAIYLRVRTQNERTNLNLESILRGHREPTERQKAVFEFTNLRQSVAGKFVALLPEFSSQFKMSVATMTRRIDFNNPTTNKPANLQNSAVLRMLEEEENRQRGGQPGSLKRVAWPPLRDDELEGFVEQAPVQSQGGPLYSSSKSETGPQNNQTPIEQKPSPISPVYQPPQTQQPKSPIINNSNSNTFQPIISPSPVTSSQQSAPQSPYQSAPLSPNVNKSPVSFLNLAKPWSLQGATPHQFKPVQPPSLRTLQTYQSSSDQYQYQSQEYTKETQNVALPPYLPAFQIQETTFQQSQTPPVVESKQSYEIIKTIRQDSVPKTKSAFSDPTQNSFTETGSPRVVDVPLTKSASFKSTTSIETPEQTPKLEPVPPVRTPQEPKSTSQAPQPKVIPVQQVVTPSSHSQPPSGVAKGIAQNQVPAQPRYQVPQKQVEPPPSTIILRPQAPVSQAPPPLVTSQPATATLRGGKNLRGDLKWPPETVRQKMQAEEEHLVELSKGPACKPRKNCKDYSRFFAKHALTHAYPGYKIPPGTQFYDHSPVM